MGGEEGEGRAMPDGWFVDGYSVRVFRDRNRSLGGHNRSFAAAVVPAIPTIGFGKAVKLGAWLAEAIYPKVIDKP